MIGQIENAIMAEIAKYSNAENMPLGYKFRTIETYPDDWASFVRDELKNKNPPLALVTFGGWQPIASNDYQSQVKAGFGIILGARNFRNQKAARHGVLGDVGSLQLVWDVAKILQGNDLGLSITGFEIGSCQYADLDETTAKTGFSLLALQISTEFTIDKKTDDFALLNDFETAFTTWDAPPNLAHQIINLPIIGEALE